VSSEGRERRSKRRKTGKDRTEKRYPLKKRIPNENMRKLGEVKRGSSERRGLDERRKKMDGIGGGKTREKITRTQSK